MFTILKKIVYRLRIFIYCLKGDIKVGKNTKIEGKIETPLNSGKIRIGNNCRIGTWVSLRPYGGEIIIGDNCSLNSFSQISGNGGVVIGNNVLIATQTVILSANHNFEKTDSPIREQGETRKITIIEDDCWIGAGVKILSGVKIERGSVIGAGSVVTKNIPPFSVCVGVPAKVIKTRGKNNG